jgi:hypothetical protein
MFRFAALIFLVACSSASAQVYRCPDQATGKLTYSDAPCMDGRQIVRQLSDEEKAINAERADIARQRNQLGAEREDLARQRQSQAAPQATAAPGGGGISHECAMAQKNAWGANAKEARKKADIICYGPEKAAQLEMQRLANKPVMTTCVHNGRVSNCVSR